MEKTYLIEIKTYQGLEQPVSDLDKNPRNNKQSKEVVEFNRHDNDNDLEKLKYKCHVDKTNLRYLGLI